MDLEPDRDSGRRTTAVAIGRVAAKLLIAAFLAAETALVDEFFRRPGADRISARERCLVRPGCDGLLTRPPYTPAQMRFAMFAWNAIALATMPWVWWKASLVMMK